MTSNYSFTFVEILHIAAIEILVQTWLRSIDDRTWATVSITKPSVIANTSNFETYEEKNALGEKVALQSGF